METDKIKQLVYTLQGEIADLIDIGETIVGPRQLRFLGSLLVPHEQAITAMEERLAPYGYLPLIRRANGGVEVLIVSKPRIKKKPKVRVNIILLVSTVITTLIAGTGLAYRFNALVSGEGLVYQGAFLTGILLIIRMPGIFLIGVPFSFALLAILVIHELGHYVASRLHGVRTTLPYFIPAPTFLGTFGAVIKTRSAIHDRRSLFDIGAAGPIAGFVVSVVVFIIGLRLSEFRYVPAGEELYPGWFLLMPAGGGLYLGLSPILRALLYLFKGSGPEGTDLLLHPVACAGWIGFLITMLNLIPAGQLDGGHICYALFGRKHFYIARVTIVMLVFTSLVNREMGMVWMFWAVLILIIGLGHAPPIDDITPLDARRKMVGAIAIAIFILCFVPAPFRWS